jgi:hypothetical protein
VLHELEQGHLQQKEAARRLRLSARQIRRLVARLEQEGDRGLVHRLRGRVSNRKIPEGLQQPALRQLRRPCYAGFGPTLATEHLARHGVVLSPETQKDSIPIAVRPGPAISPHPPQPPAATFKRRYRTRAEHLAHLQAFVKTRLR